MNIVTGGASHYRPEGKSANYGGTLVSTAGKICAGIVKRQDTVVRVRCTRIAGNYVGHGKSDWMTLAPIVVDYRHAWIWG